MQIKQIKLSAHEQNVHDRAVALTATYRGCEAKIVAIVEEVDRLKIFEKFGQTSTVIYCMKVLKLTGSLSYAFQSVARKSREVPQLLTAMNEGISISTAHKLVSTITPQNHEMWIEKAKTLPQYDLVLALRIANPKKRRATKKEPIDKVHTRLSLDVTNAVENLITLCSAHHRIHHRSHRSSWVRETSLTYVA